MKSLADLQAIRQKALDKVSLRTKGNGCKIVVGMATCGISAGARPVMTTLIETLKENDVHNVNVTMTGCIGLCRLEPIVEVIGTDGEKTTYVNVTPEKAQRIIKEHIVDGNICTDITIGEAQ